jgi:uncharacterized membrane protein
MVILMEVGIVVLNIKYEFMKIPVISLLKHMPKLIADCICANTYPLEK